MHRRAGQVLADIRPNVQPKQQSPILAHTKKNDFNRRPRKLLPNELPAAAKLTDKLIRVVAGTQSTPRHPWKHTKTLRGDELRLLEKVLHGPPVKNTPKSELQTAFAQDVEDADLALGPEDASAALIETGSLVEIRK